jgi:tetratricopeptide (TPR) repeat protein
MLSQTQLLPATLAAAIDNPMGSTEVTGVLYRMGLLTRDVDDTARMHRLVQAVTLGRLAEPDLRQRIDEAVALLAELFPDDGDEPSQWPRCAQLLPHAQAVLDHASAQQFANPTLARLLRRTGVYLQGRGLDVQLARQLHEQALAISRSLYDGDHPSVSASLTDLANDLYILEDYERAREFDEQAMEMDQRLYDGDHPDLAASLTNLAARLHMLEDYERARELNEQALAMYQRLYDGDHPHLAVSLGNLASDLRQLEEHERARELDEQALAMRQRLDES